MKNWSAWIQLPAFLLYAVLLSAGFSVDSIAQSSTIASSARQTTRLPKENVPAVWPYPNVPPPKMFEPHPDAKPDPGMNRVDYWRKLCKLEAGEFVFRTVKDVEGIYLVRPRFISDVTFDFDSPLLFDRYAPENPAGWSDLEISYSLLISLLGTPGEKLLYQRVEMPHYSVEQLRQWVPLYGRSGQVLNPQFLVQQKEQFYNAKLSDMNQYEHFDWRDIMIRRGGSGPFMRYSHSGEPLVDVEGEKKYGKYQKGVMTRRTTFHPVVEERVETIRSRYGIFWRGIDRPNDRQMGIGGGEVLLLDLQTNEILAVKRSFVLGAENWQGRDIYWRTQAICPRYQDKKGGPTALSPFIYKVLDPSGVTNAQVNK